MHKPCDNIAKATYFWGFFISAKSTNAVEKFNILLCCMVANELMTCPYNLREAEQVYFESNLCFTRIKRLTRLIISRWLNSRLGVSSLDASSSVLLLSSHKPFLTPEIL